MRVWFVCFVSLVAAGFITLTAFSIGLLFLNRLLNNESVLGFSFLPVSEVPVLESAGSTFGEITSFTDVSITSVPNSSDLFYPTEQELDCSTGLIMYTPSNITSPSVLNSTSSSKDDVPSPTIFNSNSSPIISLLSTTVPSTRSIPTTVVIKPLHQSSVIDPVTQTVSYSITTTPFIFHKHQFETTKEQVTRNYDSYQRRYPSTVPYIKRTTSAIPSTLSTTEPVFRTHRDSTITVSVTSVPSSFFTRNVYRTTRSERSARLPENTSSAVTEWSRSTSSRPPRKSTPRRSHSPAAIQLKSAPMTQRPRLTSRSPLTLFASTSVPISTASPATAPKSVSTSVAPATTSTSAAPSSGNASKLPATSVTAPFSSSELIPSESSSSMTVVAVNMSKVSDDTVTATETATVVMGMGSATQVAASPLTTTRAPERILPVRVVTII